MPATGRRRDTSPLGKHDAVPEGFIEIDLGRSRRPAGAACVCLAIRRVPGRATGRLPRRLRTRGGRRAARLDRARRPPCRRADVVVRARRARGAERGAPPGCAADRHAAAFGRDSARAQGAALALQSRRQGGLAAASAGAARHDSASTRSRSSCSYARTAPRARANSQSG